MRKALLTAMALSLAVALAACNGDTNPPTTTDNSVSAEIPVTTEAPVTTEVTTAEITAAVTTVAPETTEVTTEATTEVTTVTTTTEATTTEDTEVSIDVIPIPVEPPVTTTEAPVTTEVPVTTAPAEPPAPEVFDFAVSDLSDYITLGKYLGIEVHVTEPAPIGEEAIDEEIEALILSLPADALRTEGTALDGDTVCIDFVGSMGGVEFEGGTAADYPLTLGSHSFIDGFEEGIVGMSVGETKTLELVFPEEYYEELAGQAVAFTVTLKGIYPTMDDTTALTYFEAASVADLRDRILASLEAKRQAEIAAVREEEAWTKALANSRVTGYPKEALDEAFDANVAAYTSLAESYGIPYEELFPLMYGIPLAEAEEILLDSAKNIVAQRLLLYAIARDMQLDVSDERFEEDLAATATILGLESVDALIAQLGRDKASLKEDKLFSQVITEIVNQANFVLNK